MASFFVTAGDTEYKGETAPATKQWEALHIALNSKLVLGMKEGVSDQALVVMVMGTPREDIKRLESLLLTDMVMRADDDVPVAVNLFKDSIQEYALLLGKVARENLGGFYELRSDNGNATAPEPQA